LESKNVDIESQCVFSDDDSSENGLKDEERKVEEEK